jgi:hypothetical protein
MEKVAMQAQQHRNDVKEAIDFAERMAKQEIDSIERLHQRTLVSLSIVVGTAVLLVGVLGWIGFDHLRDAAITSAQNAMEKEVTRQVQEKLTKEHIDQIVNEQVSSYSKASLESAIQRELQTEPLSSEIRNAATAAAGKIVATKFAHRHFSQTQCDALIASVARYDDLSGYPVAIVHNALDAEAQDYAAEIGKCLSRTKLKFLAEPNAYVETSNVNGVAIYRNEKSPENFALHLQSAFEAIGVEATIMRGPASNQPPKGENSSLNIWVGSKDIR